MAEEQESKPATADQASDLKGLIAEVQHKNQQMMLLLIAILLFGITGIILLHQKLGAVRDDVSMLRTIVSSQGGGSYNKIMRELCTLDGEELEVRVQQWKECNPEDAEMAAAEMMEGGMVPPAPPPAPME